ncbi:MAG: hypothetical protein HZB67_02480 [Candidatus Aenigmarchaeota archaeon]|nr:hypothetical protein [Candidatus Aenigmarchaeota archaeon]
MLNSFTGKLIKNRIWVPKELHKGLQNSFYEFSIKQEGNEISFISKLNKDGRIVIPKTFDEMNSGVSKVSFHEVKNSLRPKVMLNRNKIDMLSLIPKKTLSGFEILALTKGDEIFSWYFASKGRPKEIIIKRYVEPKIFRFLGYYRAEGGKPRICKRRGREFSFTNKSLDLISDFIELFSVIADEKMIKATIRYNPASHEKINGIKRRLVKMGLNEESITSGKADRIQDFTVKLYITNSLLSEIINTAENNLRKYISTSKDSDLIVEYLRGVIAGDGSLYYWVDKKGSLHSRLQIFEADRNALEDIKKMLEFCGILGKIVESKKKMYIYTAYLGWKSLLFVHKNKLSPFKTYVSKKAIKMHKRFRSMKHFLILPKEFNTSQFRELTKRTYGYSASWLKDREKEGLIKRIRKEDNQNIWCLEDSALDLIKILKGVS